MIEAVILAAIFAGTMLPLAIIAIRESTGRREEAVGRAKAEANATSYATQLADTATQLKRALEAQDGLEDLLDDWALDEPVDGAFQRLLAERRAKRAARRDGDSAGTVHPNGTTERVDPDRLLRPGEDG